MKVPRNTGETPNPLQLRSTIMEATMGWYSSKMQLYDVRNGNEPVPACLKSDSTLKSAQWTQRNKDYGYSENTDCDNGLQGLQKTSAANWRAIYLSHFWTEREGKMSS